MTLETDLATGTWIVNRGILPWLKARITGVSTVNDIKGYTVELDQPYNGNAFLPFANLGGWEVMHTACMFYGEDEDGSPYCDASDPGADQVKCYLCATATKRA